MKRGPCARCQQCAFYRLEWCGTVHACVALRKFEKAEDECSFFKTPEQLYESRKKAYDRLVQNGMYSLIDEYKVQPPVKYADLMLAEG